MGDVGLLQYTGKCKPATYRLAVVVQITVDTDAVMAKGSYLYDLCRIYDFLLKTVVF